MTHQKLSRSLPLVGILLSIFSLAPFALLAQESEIIQPTSTESSVDFLMDGIAEGVGTEFTIKDSDYLDISLRSNVKITARIESIPNTLTIATEASSNHSLASFTLTGLTPNTTYYKYQDGYQNLEVVTSNTEGSITYNQDIQTDHLVFILENSSTYFIENDATGGGCRFIGNWDTETTTCTITEDIADRIQILDDDITVDGDGHTLSGELSGAGIFYTGRKNVTIQNFIIKEFTYGIFVYNSPETHITDNTFINNRKAVSLQKSNIALLEENEVDLQLLSLSNQRGFDIIDTQNTIIQNNILTMNATEYGFHNEEGITVYDSMNVALVGNEITGPHVGIIVAYTSGGAVFGNTLQNSGSYGLIMYHADDMDVLQNNFIDNGRTQAKDDSSTNIDYSKPLPLGGNYWSDFDSTLEGCLDENNDYICDSPKTFLGDQDKLPWTIPNGWKLDPPEPEILEHYYGKIAGGDIDGTKIYIEPDVESTAIKNLPNDWIVNVISTTDAEHNGEWVQIIDPTDNTLGWLPGGMNNVPYEENMQGEYERVGTTEITTKAERAEIIKEAVNHYLSNTDTDPSLYSGKDTADLPRLVEQGFPVELIYAIAAQESGGVDFDNEIVSYDYGHGVMQITFHARWNEPDNFIDNNWDNRGKYSSFRIPVCKNIIEDPVRGQDNIGLDEYKNCYQNVDLIDNLRKPYDYYAHDSRNPKYKQYINNLQSIYANIKDGIGVLQKDKFLKKCPADDLILASFIFTCKDVELFFMVWGYNGWTTRPAFNYMREIAYQLENLSYHFHGESYHNNDNLIEKLRVANDNRKTLKAYSPVEVSITDDDGNTTGLVNGEEVNEMYTAGYSADDEAVVIFFPEGNLTYTVHGTATNTYGLVIESVEEGERVVFEAIDLPTTPSAIHTYTLNHQILGEGGQGVIIQIDNDGDGTAEQILTVGNGLDDITPPEVTFSEISTEYIVGEYLDLNSLEISISDNTDPNPTYQISLNDSDVTNELHVLLQPGKNIVRIIVTDSTGNTAIAEKILYARYIFTGFESPLEYNDTFTLNETIPIKFGFQDIDGNILDSVNGELHILDQNGSILYIEKFAPAKLGNYHINAKMNYDTEQLILEIYSDDGSLFSKILTRK